MYNLLISSKDGIWEKLIYEYEQIRIFEYTPDHIKLKYNTLDEKNSELLKEYPTLFLYEGFRGIAKIGFITSIQKTNQTIRIKFSFINGISGFEAEILNKLKLELNITDWEVNRTHWAVKDEDLINILYRNGILTRNQVDMFRKPKKIQEINFDVAFSFPGEKRTEIVSIVNAFKNNFPEYTIFYDEDFTAQLAIPNLDIILQEIYSKQSKLICVFLCEEYEKKEWCRLEWKAIRQILNTKDSKQIMYFRFDQTSIPGVFKNDGYIELSKFTPEKISIFINERIQTI